jgi:hypothetical protein
MSACPSPATQAAPAWTYFLPSTASAHQVQLDGALGGGDRTNPEPTWYFPSRARTASGQLWVSNYQILLLSLPPRWKLGHLLPPGEGLP